jgi:diadenylate cyclase
MGDNLQKKEVQKSLIDKPEEEIVDETDIYEALKLIAPGTQLRTGIESIVKAHTGAIIVVENDLVHPLLEGGFRIFSRFTPQRLLELSKMDGAMVLSKNLKKILFANVLLTPDTKIKTHETGTRHKAAERIARQAGTIVIAISQRRNEITLFYKNKRYLVKDTSEIIRRAMETLQILEKHKETFQSLQRDLNIQEIQNRVKIDSVLRYIQRGVIIMDLANVMRENLIELGSEGAIINGRLKEIIYEVEDEVLSTLHDYSELGAKKSLSLLQELNHDNLLDIHSIKSCLGVIEGEKRFSPKGHRFLMRAGMPDNTAGTLMREFGSLYKIISQPVEGLEKFFDKEESQIISEVIERQKKSELT